MHPATARCRAAATRRRQWLITLTTLREELESGGTVTEGMRQVLRVAKTRLAQAQEEHDAAIAAVRELSLPTPNGFDL